MKTVALLSGGIDSTVMVWKLKSEGHEIFPLTFLTYRRNVKEVEAVKKIAPMVSPRELQILDFSFMREIIDYPDSFKAKMHEFPTIFIPYRNLIFYSVAAHLASYVGADYVAGGHTFEDVGRLPDVSDSFLRMLEGLFKISAPTLDVRILTPLLKLRKHEILKLGMELDAPLNLTWSCWGLLEKHCGRCPGCMARKQAFKAAGLNDETEYLEI